MGQDEVMRVVKRPGLSLEYTRSGFGGGMWAGGWAVFYTPVEGGFTGNLYFAGTLIASLGAYAGAYNPSRFFTFEYVATGLQTNTLMLQDTYSVWTYDLVAGLRSVPLANTTSGPITCSITHNSPVVTTVSTEAIRKYSLVTGTGIPANTTVASIDSATQFTLSADATATNATASLTLTYAGPFGGNGLPGPSLLAGPSRFAPGVVHLNNAAFLFGTQAAISNSDVNDPYAWEPLSFIYAYAELDKAVALSKNLSYIVAFKQQSTEFFRDVGASPGSPLERLEGLRLAVGCYAPRAVTVVDGTVMWVSVTESGIRSVFRLDNTKATEIATPAIRRVLERVNITYGISFSIAGHSFYVITDPVAKLSLVYDLTSNFWSYWDAFGSGYFPFVSAVSDGTTTLLQHESNGKVYRLDPTLVTDEGANFTLDVYPPQFDGSMRIAKYLSRMYVLADQEPGSRLLVRTSDDDQLQRTWTQFREIDLGSSRPDLYDLGTFTKRWFHFRHEGAAPCRLIAVELEVLACTL